MQRVDSGIVFRESPLKKFQNQHSISLEEEHEREKKGIQPSSLIKARAFYLALPASFRATEVFLETRMSDPSPRNA